MADATQAMRNDLEALEAFALRRALSLTITNRGYASYPIIAACMQTIITELTVAAEVARMALDMGRDDDVLIRARAIVAEQCERAVETMGAVLLDVAVPETDSRH